MKVLGVVQMGPDTLELTAYRSPAKEERLQFRLSQGEGVAIAYANASRDTVAEVIGLLETWLAKPGAAIDGPGVRLMRQRLEIDERRTALERLTAALLTLEEVKAGGVVRFAAVSRLERIEGLLRDAVRDLEGPRPLSVAEEVITPDDREHGQPRRPVDPDGYVGSALWGASKSEDETRETPATNALERADVATALEAWGEVGEEAEALRRAGVHADVATIGNAVREVTGCARRLAEYCHTESIAERGPLELEELTHHAARFVLARQGLEGLLRLATEDK